MRDRIDHLPATKQHELEHVTRVLFEEFEAATRRGNQPFARKARIFKQVLYGSYARGDWVDDPVGGYKSDYDILVVVNDDRLTDFDYWTVADDRLMREMTIARTLSAPVNFVVHSLTDVNSQIVKGRPFFTDILKQGVALYEAEGFPFSTPGVLPPQELKGETQKHFDHWFPLSVHALKLGRDSIVDGVPRDAAFMLHQASERAYHCINLVLTLYSPKSHRLSFLRGHAEDLAPSLIEAWPRGDRFSRRCFELLRQAYVNARYSPHYEISGEELAWLSERVAVLQDLVKLACEQHLATL